MVQQIQSPRLVHAFLAQVWACMSMLAAAAYLPIVVHEAHGCFGVDFLVPSISGVIFWSRLGFMPDYDIDLTCVVGKPLELPHIPNPSEEDVDKHHQAYIARMQALFDKHKDKYGSKGATLEIF